MKIVMQSLVLLMGALMLPATVNAQQAVYGDVNGDFEVNIADVNSAIDLILSTGSSSSADVNGDGEINIADVNTIIDIILGGGAPTPDEHEYVDLGLPSGTLWATCNVGASSPEQYGDYFAWGETETKESYEERNYKWYKKESWISSTYKLTKYCTNSEDGYQGFVDNKTELDTEDDAAYVNWGPLWRMPSVEQINELLELCTGHWTQSNGVNGVLFTGTNGNSLFLPAAGMRVYDEFWDVSSAGAYWSRTLSTGAMRFAYCLEFNSEGWGWWHFYRDTGFIVRAVRAPQD